MYANRPSRVNDLYSPPLPFFPSIHAQSLDDTKQVSCIFHSSLIMPIYLTPVQPHVELFEHLDSVHFPLRSFFIPVCGRAHGVGGELKFLCYFRQDVISAERNPLY